MMDLHEMLKGESKNIEYKSELPKKSERYLPRRYDHEKGRRGNGVLPTFGRFPARRSP